MKTYVTNDEFFAAVEGGDARTIAMFVAQEVPAGMSSADAVEALIGETGRRDGEWLPPLDAASYHKVLDEPLAEAIDLELIDVIAWMFSAEAIAVVGPELLVEVIPIACQLALRHKPRVTLEPMLASPVFSQLLSGEQQQSLLDQLLEGVPRYSIVGLVDLLVAHGARVNSQFGASDESVVLRRVARHCVPATVQAVVRNGAFTVAAPVLEKSDVRHYEDVLQLLAYGMRPTNAAKCLHWAILFRNAGAARRWLEHGFVDVDERDVQGRTPLMRVNSTRMTEDEGARFAKLLLEFGASVEAKDPDDRTPLRYALAFSFAEVVRLLLEHGADPNQPTDGDHVVLDFVPFDRLDEPVIAKKLEHLLHYGANPYLPGTEGLSAVDRLHQSEEGRAFIATHPKWFMR